MQKLIELVPAEELENKLSQIHCELSFEFLCFEELYNIIATAVPKDKIIIDIGCYMGAQAYFFLENPIYIGVDNYELLNLASPKRFITNNSIHIVCDALNWIKEHKWKQILGATSLEQVYAICSGLPNKQVRDTIYTTFPNCTIFYPRDIIITKGIKANEIESTFCKKLKK